MSVVYKPELPDRGPFALEICKLLHTLKESESYEDVTALADALAKYKISAKNMQDRDTYVSVLTNSKGEDTLVVRLPAVAEAPKDIKDIAAYYINFATSLLGIKSGNVRIHFDESLGNTLKCPKTVKGAIDGLLKSARSSTGFVGMKTHKFENGFSAPLPGLVCAIRILKKHLPTYRKVSKKAVHLEKLRDAVANEFGFKNPGFNEFVKDFLTQVLAQMTSEKQTFFPASYYACVKKENDKSTTLGILAKLGYVCIVPNPDKVKYVATRIVVKDENGAPTKIEGTDEEHSLERNKEYEAGVKLLLPLLDASLNVKLKQQLKDPLRFLSIRSQVYLKSMASVIDEVNKAYAFLSAYENKRKGNKTKITHVVGKIGESTRQVKNQMVFRDATGTLWPKYEDIPYDYRKFFEKILMRRKSPKKKRSASVPPEEQIKKKSKTAKCGTATDDPKGSQRNQFAVFREDDEMGDGS
jgi:hypothetical protein